MYKLLNECLPCNIYHIYQYILAVCNLTTYYEIFKREKTKSPQIWYMHLFICDIFLRMDYVCGSIFRTEIMIKSLIKITKLQNNMNYTRCQRQACFEIFQFDVNVVKYRAESSTKLHWVVSININNPFESLCFDFLQSQKSWCQFSFLCN